MRSERGNLFARIMVTIALISVGFIDHYYRLLFGSIYSPFISLLLVTAAIIIILIIAHAIFYIPYKRMQHDVRKSYKEIMAELAITTEEKPNMNVSENLDNFHQLMHLYKTSQKEQCELVCELTNTNKILEQNNKFANAIMQITSEILSSKDIHSILQLILDKAIEIIPNAQKGSILLYNQDYLEYKAMYGYDMEALKDFKFRLDEIFQHSAPDLYEPIIIPDVEQFNTHLKKDKFNVLKDTRSFELKSSISCAIKIDGEFYGTINIDNIDSNYAFVEEHKPMIKYFAEQIGIALKNAQLIEKILYLSQFDSLTSICNRAYFEERLGQLHNQCKENNKTYSLVILDMNDLKKVNDTYGHDAGDSLIVTFTEYIQHMEQKPEIFGRIGGDEFALAYTNKSEAELQDIMKSIKKYFSAAPFKHNGVDLLTISFGFGICTFPTEANDIPTMFKYADQKMYENKRKIKSQPVE